MSQATKAKVLEACHNDRVGGGCHFGRDKTAFKVSQTFYWKRLNGRLGRFVIHMTIMIITVLMHGHGLCR